MSVLWDAPAAAGDAGRPAAAPEKNTEGKSPAKKGKPVQRTQASLLNLLQFHSRDILVLSGEPFDQREGQDKDHQHEDHEGPGDGIGLAHGDVVVQAVDQRGDQHREKAQEGAHAVLAAVLAAPGHAVVRAHEHAESGYQLQIWNRRLIQCITLLFRFFMPGNADTAGF